VNVVALVLWITTAIGGFTMAGIWIAHNGPAQHAEGVTFVQEGSDSDLTRTKVVWQRGGTGRDTVRHVKELLPD
jgi:hypothetical protein